MDSLYKNQQRDLHMMLANKALEYFQGSQTRMALAMQSQVAKSALEIGPILQGHVGNWVHGRRIVSPHMAVYMELATKAKAVTREQFYPELYRRRDVAA